MSSIIRVRKRTGYSIIANAPLADNGLSWEARGVLAYLLTKPDDWTVSVDQLVGAGPGSRDRMQRILKELETARYLHRERVKDEHGHWAYESELYETPCDGPQPDSPCVENRATVSIYNQELKQQTKGDSKESPHADAWRPFKEAFQTTFALGGNVGTWKLAAKAIEVLHVNGVAPPDAVPTWEAFVAETRGDKAWRFVRPHSAWEWLAKWIADKGLPYLGPANDDWKH